MKKIERLKRLLGAGIAVVSVSILINDPAYAQADTQVSQGDEGATETLNKTAVSGWLSDQFEVFLEQCNSKLPKAFKDKSVQYVPNEMQLQLRDHWKKSGLKISGQRLLRIFDTVHSYDASIKTYTPVGDALKIAENIGVDREIDTLASNVTFTHDCLTAISAGMKLKSGFDLGFLKSKKALTADMMSDRKIGISIVYGLFPSPIFKTNKLSEEETLSNSSIWRWYQNNPKQVGKDNYVWKQLHGIVGYNLSDIMWNKKYSASGTAGVGGGLGPLRIGVKADGSAEFRGTGQLTANLFRAIAFDNDDSDSIDNMLAPAKLPSLAQAAAGLKKASGRVISDNNKLPAIVTSESIVLSFAVDGLAICDSSWNIDEAKETGKLSKLLGNPSAVDTETDIPKCLFDIEYTPTKYNDNRTSYILKIPLKRTVDFGTPAAPDQKTISMAVNLGELSDLRGTPKFFRRSSGDVEVADEAISVNASWFVDAGKNSINSYRPRIFRYDCASRKLSGVAQVSNTSETSFPSNRVIDLTFTLPIQKQESALVCEITGEIKTNHIDGKSHTRSVESLNITIPPKVSESLE